MKVFLLKFIIVLGFIFCSCFKHTLANNFPDSIAVPASKKYKKPGLLRIFFLGANYRREWSVPVKMPVFNLEKDPRGFIIKDSGGGKQTKSLELEDSQGKIWVLRSVDKSVDKTLPNGLKKSFVESIIQDLISASYPYGGLSVPTLSQAANVSGEYQQLYYVPDDPAFGQYRALLANSVCLLVLKERPVLKLVKTKEILHNLGSGDYVIDQEALLRARLLDWLMGDWDRHEDQWRWAVRDSAGLKWYYPIPRDRDQAFFHSEGFLVRMITLFFMPHANGFDWRAHSIKRLGYKSRLFDRNFLNGLDHEQWIRIVREFQEKLSDSVIEQAIKKQPPEIYSISGHIIIRKLKSRRDRLLADALEYYEFLAKQVIILGSHRDDLVRIDYPGDRTNIRIYNRSGILVYQRFFDPLLTKRIVVDGREGDDRFLLDKKRKGIKIFLLGGDGRNEYLVRKED